MSVSAVKFEDSKRSSDPLRVAGILIHSDYLFLCLYVYISLCTRMCTALCMRTLLCARVHTWKLQVHKGCLALYLILRRGLFLNLEAGNLSRVARLQAPGVLPSPSPGMRSYAWNFTWRQGFTPSPHACAAQTDLPALLVHSKTPGWQSILDVQIYQQMQSTG